MAVDLQSPPSQARISIRVSDPRIVASSPQTSTSDTAQHYRNMQHTSRRGENLCTITSHAPRLAPLDLPLPLLSDRSDDSDSAEETSDEELERDLLAALAPLSDLIALPSPPSELDAFDDLSLS